MPPDLALLPVKIGYIQWYIKKTWVYNASTFLYHCFQNITTGLTNFLSCHWGMRWATWSETNLLRFLFSIFVLLSLITCSSCHWFINKHFLSEYYFCLLAVSQDPVLMLFIFFSKAKITKCLANFPPTLISNRFLY